LKALFQFTPNLTLLPRVPLTVSVLSLAVVPPQVWMQE